MALLQALSELDYFDLIAVAPTRELFVPLCQPLFPDMIIVDERAAMGAPGELAHQIAQGRRIVPVVVESGRGPRTEATSLTVKLLHRSDREARNEIETALYAAATPIMTAKRTLLAGDFDNTVAISTRPAATRNEVAQMGAWPLDLILLVDDGGSIGKLAEIFTEVAELPVPVMIAIDSDQREHGQLLTSMPNGARELKSPTTVRHMEKVYLVPHDRQVQLSGENVWVGEGELSIEYLIASMAWLKSGGLTIVMSCSKTERTTTLGGVAAGGGLVAMLDPAHCVHPEAARASATWPVPPLLLAPEELKWLLQCAVPRKG